MTRASASQRVLEISLMPSRRIHGVLLVDRRDDFRNGDIQFRELVWFDPEAHGVLACAENRYAGDARHPGEFVVEIDIGVVREEFCIVSLVRRRERDEEEG